MKSRPRKRGLKHTLCIYCVCLRRKVGRFHKQRQCATPVASLHQRRLSSRLDDLLAFLYGLLGSIQRTRFINPAYVCLDDILDCPAFFRTRPCLTRNLVCPRKGETTNISLFHKHRTLLPVDATGQCPQYEQRDPSPFNVETVPHHLRTIKTLTPSETQT